MKGKSLLGIALLFVSAGCTTVKPQVHYDLYIYEQCDQYRVCKYGVA